VAGASAGLGYWILIQDLPRLDTIKDYHPPLATSVHDSKGELIGEFYKERRILAPFTSFPKYLSQAFVAAEDARFFEHKGVDPMSIARALIKDILAGEIVQGGSTITQQVTKSILLSPEKSWVRKVKEVILAYRIERRLNKEEILYLYLNQIYFGHGAYGIEAAAQHYFGKRAKDLSLAETTLLAGLPKAPSRYSPVTNPEGARERQAYVVQQMIEEKYITEAEGEGVLQQPIRLLIRPPKAYREAPYFLQEIRSYLESRYGEEAILQEGLHVMTTLDLTQQRAAEKAVRQGLEELDQRHGWRGPLDHIQSSEWKKFRKKIQLQIDASLKESLLKADGTLEPLSWELQDERRELKIGETYTALVTQPLTSSSAKVAVGDYEGTVEWSGWLNHVPPPKKEESPQTPSPVALKAGDVIRCRAASKEGSRNRGYRFALYQEPTVEGALLSLDPKTGEVRAMVGGLNFERSQFNRALQALRQPGSAFKPIIYSAAIDRNITPATVILDTPIVYENPDEDSTWKPENYDEKFIGAITVRDALAHSRNAISIKILEKIGVRYAIQYAHKLGIASTLQPDLTLALGSSSVTLLELCRAYAVFASGGWRVEPILWKRITNRMGQTLEEIEVIPHSGNRDNLEERKGSAPPATRILRDLFPGRNNNEEEAFAFKNQMEPTQVLSPQTAFIMTELLKDVIEHGTGQRVRALGRPAAGKTGTTNDLNDAWFIGYTPNLLTGVWVGYDQKTPLGKQETGARAASPIWLYFMSEAVQGKPVTDFSAPEGVVFAKIDLETGFLADTKSKRTAFLPFKDGTAPTQSSETKRDSVTEEVLKYGF
jgi:penicillin-binding protein 1A